MSPQAHEDDNRRFRDKPVALCELADPLAQGFPIVKAWFRVPDSVALDLAHVDAVDREMFEPQMVAAFTLRKIQALRLLSRPGVETPLGAVLSLISDIRSALRGMLERSFHPTHATADLRAVETLCGYLEAAARSLGHATMDVPISVEIWLR